MVKVVVVVPEAGMTLIGTLTVPNMVVGWTGQWYSNDPAALKTQSNELPGVNDPESHHPTPVVLFEWFVVSLVVPCGVPNVALFVQCTVSPRLTDAGFGLKEKLTIETFVVVAATAAPC